MDTQSARDIIEGISEYGHGPRQWELLLIPALHPTPADIRRFWREIDGVICHTTDRAIWSLPGRMRVPVVTVQNSHDGSRFPVVRDDEDTLSKLALEHLRDIGLSRVGFLDFSPEPSFRAKFMERHARAMSMEWNRFGLPFETLEGPWLARERLIAEWARALDMPIGIVAFSANQARELTSACRLVGIAVPEEVAILSVGDELACRLSIPPVSSIDMGYRRLGEEAAAVLDDMLHGRPPAQRVLLHRAVGVIPRRSTDVLHTGNLWVARALRFIRDHQGQSIGVRDIVAFVGTSRRVLEYAVQRHLGRSLHQEILRQQIARARELLARSDSTMTEIADACGLRDRTRLSALFRRLTGMTPRQYRAQFHPTRRGNA